MILSHARLPIPTLPRNLSPITIRLTGLTIRELVTRLGVEPRTC